MSDLPEADENTNTSTPTEPTQRVPPFARVLARILVRQALEEEGILEPANDNTVPPR